MVSSERNECNWALVLVYFFSCVLKEKTIAFYSADQITIAVSIEPKQVKFCPILQRAISYENFDKQLLQDSQTGLSDTLDLH